MVDERAKAHPIISERIGFATVRTMGSFRTRDGKLSVLVQPCFDRHQIVERLARNGTAALRRKQARQARKVEGPKVQISTLPHRKQASSTKLVTMSVGRSELGVRIRGDVTQPWSDKVLTQVM